MTKEKLLEAQIAHDRVRYTMLVSQLLATVDEKVKSIDLSKRESIIQLLDQETQKTVREFHGTNIESHLEAIRLLQLALKDALLFGIDVAIKNVQVVHEISKKTFEDL